MPTKKCTQCLIQKDTVDFPKASANKDGRHSFCRECHRKSMISSQRKKKSNCTQEQYDILFAKQKGCCAICGTHVSNLKRNLAADHCHTTKTMRGLLCGKCNFGIGYLNDDIQLLKNAIKYLKFYNKGN